jgi:hypothetical protein
MTADYSVQKRNGFFYPTNDFLEKQYGITTRIACEDNQCIVCQSPMATMNDGDVCHYRAGHGYFCSPCFEERARVIAQRPIDAQAKMPARLQTVIDAIRVHPHYEQLSSVERMVCEGVSRNNKRSRDDNAYLRRVWMHLHRGTPL